MTAILGISAFYHDSAATLVVDGQIVAVGEPVKWEMMLQASGMQAAILAAQAIQLGRAKVVQRGTRFGVVVDKPSSMVQMFGMGNIIAGTCRSMGVTVDGQ